MQQGPSKPQNLLFQGREATLNFALIETLALHPNQIKSEMVKEVKKISYVKKRMVEKKFKVVPSTVSRRVDALGKQNWIAKSGERPVKLFKGAITPEYTLSFRGLINYFSVLGALDITREKIIKIVENYSDVGLLAFKKWSLFKGTKLESRMLLTIIVGINSSVKSLVLENKYFNAQVPPDEELLKKTIDLNIFFYSQTINKDMELASIFKEDYDIRTLIDEEFAALEKHYKNLLKLKDLWTSV